MNQAAVPGADTDKGALFHPGAGKPFLERLFKGCTARDPRGGLVLCSQGSLQGKAKAQQMVYAGACETHWALLLG